MASDGNAMHCESPGGLGTEDAARGAESLEWYTQKAMP